ncbi:hypothetical protein MASR1M107_28440 [Ignavibacteriales bacterium]
MFTTEFYNFGYTGATIADFEKIIEELIKKKEIKYLIFGLDHWMFNPLWVEKQKPMEELENESLFSLSPLKAIKLIRSKHFFPLLTKIELRNRALGINALKGNGLRRDGSYQYGELIASVANGDTTAEDYKFKNTLTRILNRNNRFESFVQFYLQSFQKLEMIIEHCKNNGIHLILFLSPLPETVLKSMLKDNEYGNLRKLAHILSKMAAIKGVRFFDFLDAKKLGMDDSLFLDGFHGSEVVYAKILLNIAEKDTLLSNVINVENINKKLLKVSRFTIF